MSTQQGVAMAPIDEAREKALTLMAAINPRFTVARKQDPEFREREVNLIAFALLAAYEAGARPSASRSGPWHAFFRARGAAILWLVKEFGYDDATISHLISTDPGQVTLCRMTAEEKRNGGVRGSV